jgi:CheY-like chemotaxis protein
VECVFAVTDTGCGIPLDFQKKVFEPFSQAPNATINKVHGSGTGLMIVKNLVEMMRGTISLQSDVKQGTTVTISLLLSLAKRPPVSAASEQCRIRAISQSLVGKRILVVEDNQLNAEIGQAILEKAGVIVSVAENGRIAVELVKSVGENYYDAILMDIRMPVMGGIEATTAIRSLDAAWCKTVPIIAATADAFDEDVRRFLDCGMNDCLTKPIDVAKLYEVLARYLGTEHV